MKKFSLLAEGLLALALALGLWGYSGATAPAGRLYVMILALLAVPFALLARTHRAGLSEAGVATILLWAALSAARSPMPRTAIEATAVFATGGLVFLAAPALDGRIVNGALFASAAALAVSVLGETVAAVRLLGSIGFFVQPGGFFGNANFAGVLLAAALLLALAPAPSRLDPRLRAGFAILFLPALLLTGSRTAVLSLALGLVTLHGFSRKSALLLAGLAGLAVLVFLRRIEVLFDPAHLTNLQRVAMAKTAWAGATEAPILGHGIGTFPILGVRHLAFPKWELHLHDVFLDALFALGFPGLAATAAAWSYGMYAAFRRRDGVATALLASLLTDDLLWIPGFLLLAALYARGRAAASPAAAPVHEGIRMGGAMAAAILGAVFMVFGGAVPAHSDRRAVTASAVAAEDPAAAAREIFPDRPGLLAARWALLARAGVFDRVDLARVGGTEALEDPGFARQAALLHEARGEREDAIWLLALALRNDPHNVLGPHHLDLARIRLARGETAAAAGHLLAADRKMPRLAAVFRRLHGLGPSDTRARGSEVLTADHAYRLEESEGETTTDPLHFRHYRGRAAAAFARGDLEEADRQIRRAHFLARREVGYDPRTLRLLLEIGRARGEKTDAIGWLLYRARAPRGPYGAVAARAYARTLPADGELAPWMGGPR